MAAKEKTKVDKVSQQLREGDKTTDVVFNVDGKKLYFSKALLECCSPVLSKMATPECLQQHPDGIPLEGKKYTAMEILFQLMHPAFVLTAPLTDNLLLDVLDLAKEYEVDHIKTRCEQYISNKPAIDASWLSIDQLLLYLTACDQHGLKQPREQLVKLASQKSYRELEWSRRNGSYAASALLDVFRSRCEELEKKESELRSKNSSLVRSLQSIQSCVSKPDDVLRKKVSEELIRVTLLIN